MRVRTLLSWISVLGLASPGLTCCLAYGEHPMSLVDEKAIIIWNAAEKKQHFIRQASFEGKAKDFGFIVPTPTKPEVAAVSEKAFDELEKLIPIPSTHGYDSAPDTKAATGSVEVLEQLRVGDYQATILKATDGSSMLGWLKNNHYKTRPAMESWLDHYAKKGWIFTALKFVREKNSTDPKTKALRLSFSAEQPHYPYKMPDDTWPSGHVRPLALYFIASGKVKANYEVGHTNWEAQKVAHVKLPSHTQKALQTQLKMTASDFPANPTMTIFSNSRNENGYSEDLVFPLTSMIDGISFDPKVGLLTGLLVVLVLWLLFRRRKVIAKPL